MSGPPPNAIPPVTVSGTVAVDARARRLDLHRRREAAVELDVSRPRSRATPVASASRRPATLEGRRAEQIRPGRHGDHRVGVDHRDRMDPVLGAATPSSSATALDTIRIATAWSTFHCEQWRLVYGLDTIRFPGDVGSAMSSGDRGTS